MSAFPSCIKILRMKNKILRVFFSCYIIYFSSIIFIFIFMHKHFSVSQTVNFTFIYGLNEKKNNEHTEMIASTVADVRRY